MKKIKVVFLFQETPTLTISFFEKQDLEWYSGSGEMSLFDKLILGVCLLHPVFLSDVIDVTSNYSADSALSILYVSFLMQKIWDVFLWSTGYIASGVHWVCTRRCVDDTGSAKKCQLIDLQWHLLCLSWQVAAMMYIQGAPKVGCSANSSVVTNNCQISINEHAVTILFLWNTKCLYSSSVWDCYFEGYDAVTW